jgi:hypothetical protein
MVLLMCSMMQNYSNCCRESQRVWDLKASQAQQQMHMTALLLPLLAV